MKYEVGPTGGFESFLTMSGNTMTILTSDVLLIGTQNLTMTVSLVDKPLVTKTENFKVVFTCTVTALVWEATPAANTTI